MESKYAAGITIRQANAEDVEKIYQLVREHSDQGMMLPRSRYKLISRLLGCVVAEDEAHNLIGCGVLVILWSDLAEVQSLVVDATKRRKYAGRQIVEALINKAAALHIQKVLALTYQVEFFQKIGFQIVAKASIPRKIWGECLECPKLENCDETAMIYYLNPGHADDVA